MVGSYASMPKSLDEKINTTLMLFVKYDASNYLAHFSGGTNSTRK